MILETFFNNFLLKFCKFKKLQNETLQDKNLNIEQID